MEATLQRIFRAEFAAYAGKRRLPLHQHKAAAAISDCRTAALGAHVERCPDNHVERIWYNSCGHRSCPQCRNLRMAHWLDNQRERLLACDHYHVIFTIASELHDLWRMNRRLMANLLFRASRDTLFELLGDPRYLGGRPGCIASLHTWGRSGALHPHAHFLVTGGGLGEDGRWTAVSNGYLLPFQVLRKLFRGKYLAGMWGLLSAGKLSFPAGQTEADVKRTLRRVGRGKKWNAYICQRYPHGQGVLTYLARYLRGGAISNRRILRHAETGVTFCFTCQRSKKREILTLPTDAFIARFLEHVPLPRMQTVRYYGIYARQSRGLLNRCRQLLGQPEYVKPRPVTRQEYWQRIDRPNPTVCSVCGKPLVYVRRLLPEQRRGPPRVLADVA